MYIWKEWLQGKLEAVTVQGKLMPRGPGGKVSAHGHFPVIARCRRKLADLVDATGPGPLCPFRA